MDFKRIWISFRMFTLRSGVQRAAYLKKHNIYDSIRENVMIQPRILPLYPKLIRFGDNVRIASGVTFVTHDAIHNMLNNMSPKIGGRYLADVKFHEKIGCIEVGSNVFIGANSTILHDVRIGNNVIVAAGSVVVNDIPDGSLCGGVPAKVIKSFDDYYQKRYLAEKEDTKVEFRTEAISDEAVAEEWKIFYERRTSETQTTI